MGRNKEGRGKECVGVECYMVQMGRGSEDDQRHRLGRLFVLYSITLG